MRESLQTANGIATLLGLFAATTHRTLTGMDIAPLNDHKLFADRISAMARISNGAFDEIASFEELLAEGGAAIRPGHPFIGRICRVDGSDIVIEHQAMINGKAEDFRLLIEPHARLALEGTAQRDAVSLGRTCYWDDLQADPNIGSRPVARGAGIRSIIVTPIRVGRHLYTLAFASPQQLAQPFTVDDVTFVEVLAGYLERRLVQVWQESRIQYQMHHDPLTGLLNRNRFRTLAGEAIETSERCGLVIIDLSGLQSINEEYGYQVGDGLLIEVSATLAAMARDHEFVGRLYGDSFGLCLPGIASLDAVRARVGDLATIFSTPFPTGDREHALHLPVRAAFGMALSPEHGTSFDSLIRAAEIALAPVARYGILPLEINILF